jgi:hypothetical protein
MGLLGSGLNGTSQSFPQSAQTALCISLSDIFDFSTPDIGAVQKSLLTRCTYHNIHTYKQNKPKPQDHHAPDIPRIRMATDRR